MKIPEMPAGAIGCTNWDREAAGKHQTKNLKFLAYQQGLAGAQIGILELMVSIKLKI